MKAKLLGVKFLDFEPPGSAPVQGTKLFFSYNDHEKNTIGEVCDNVYISDENSEKLTISPMDFVGEVINFEFDRKGKIQCVSA